ncbi:MAG: RluA family pseudouridine synthase [Pseudomonadota bacterium]
MNEHKITAEDSDIRLDRWFKRHFPSVTHGFIEKALRKGDIRLNGKKVKSSERVAEGQTIIIRCKLPEAEEAQIKKPVAFKTSSEDAAMLMAAVLYKDDDIIIINKPAGLAVQGGTGITKNIDAMLDCLRFDAKERPKLVHRLDRDTSGVLVLARSAKSATRITKLFASKEVIKVYWALVIGVPEIMQGKIDLPLSKQEDGDIEKVGVDKIDGKKAITLYRVIDRLSNKLCWVELSPITGRTHQLRVHMSEIGHPILGDGKYGGKDAFIEGMDISRKLHLHAQKIIIPDVLEVEAPLPPHMKKSWRTLGLE